MSDQRPISAAAVPAGWAGILEPGENILWQGTPAFRLRLGLIDRANAIQGLFMIGFGIFWIWMLPRFDLLFIAAGLFMIGIGLRQTIGPALTQAYLMKHSFYTLTDRRAILATDSPIRGRRLVSYPVEAGTQIAYSPTEPPSILFGPQTYGVVRPGFMYIPEADRVIEMMRQIQRAQQPAPDAPPEQPDPEDRQP